MYSAHIQYVVTYSYLLWLSSNYSLTLTYPSFLRLNRYNTEEITYSRFSSWDFSINYNTSYDRTIDNYLWLCVFVF